MTKKQFRNSKEYENSIKKIKNYHKGFKFTLPYYKMTQGQKNAMNIITNDSIEEKLIESVSIGLSLSGEVTEETFVRLQHW